MPSVSKRPGELDMNNDSIVEELARSPAVETRSEPPGSLASLYNESEAFSTPGTADTRSMSAG
jgi:hypothetical protein